MLAIQGGGKKTGEKICQCNWKTKGSLPKKIMRSHQSNVRQEPSYNYLASLVKKKRHHVLLPRRDCGSPPALE